MDWTSDYKPSEEEIRRLEETLANTAGEGLVGAALRDLYGLPTKKATPISPENIGSFMHFVGPAKPLESVLMERYYGPVMQKIAKDKLARDVYMEILGGEDLTRALRSSYGAGHKVGNIAGWTDVPLWDPPLLKRPARIVLTSPLEQGRMFKADLPPIAESASHESTHYTHFSELPLEERAMLERTARRVLGSNSALRAKFKTKGYQASQMPEELIADVASGGEVEPEIEAMLKSLGIIPRAGINPLTTQENHDLVQELLRLLL